MDPIVYLIIGTVAGTLLTWVIRKLIVEKDLVSRNDLNEKNNFLMQAENKVQFLQEKLNDIQTAVIHTESEIKRITEEKEARN